MTLAEQAKQLIHGHDPFDGFDPGGLEADLQGWLEAPGVLVDIIAKVKPRVLVEVGVWKGRSALLALREALKYNDDVVLICIDTWLGSDEHWLDPKLKGLLNIAQGRPRLFEQFMTNVVHSGLERYVAPLPLPSRSAAAILHCHKLRASYIYLDAAHDERSVAEDIALFWPLVTPGGVLVGDDYHPSWPGVIRAVDPFLEKAPGIANSGVAGRTWFAQKNPQESEG